MKRTNKAIIGGRLIEGLAEGDRERIDNATSANTIHIRTQEEWNEKTQYTYQDIDWNAMYAWENWYYGGQQGQEPAQFNWANPPMREYQAYGFRENANVQVHCDLLIEHEYSCGNAKINFNGHAVMKTNDAEYCFSFADEIVNVALFQVSGHFARNCNLVKASTGYNHPTAVTKWGFPSQPMSGHAPNGVFCNVKKVEFTPEESNQRQVMMTSTSILFNFCQDVEIIGGLEHYQAAVAHNCNSVKAGYLCCNMHGTPATIPLFRDSKNITISDTVFYYCSAPAFLQCKGIRISRVWAEQNYPMFKECSDITVTDEATAYDADVFDNCTNLTVFGMRNYNRSGRIFKDCSLVLVAAKAKWETSPANWWKGVNTKINTNACEPNADGTYGAVGSTSASGAGDDLYVHNILMYSAGNNMERFMTQIITKSATPFTFATLREWLYSRGYTSQTNLYMAAGGVLSTTPSQANAANTMSYLAVGIWANTTSIGVLSNVQSNPAIWQGGTYSSLSTLTDKVNVIN